MKNYMITDKLANDVRISGAEHFGEYCGRPQS